MLYQLKIKLIQHYFQKYKISVFGCINKVTNRRFLFHHISVTLFCAFDTETLNPSVRVDDVM